MKIATWNVNSIRVRMEHLLCFLQEHDVDIMLLQEVKCAPEAFPEQILNDAGYNCVFYCQKTYNGVAILSKYIIEDVVDGSRVFHDDINTRYIEAVINGYVVASVYVPNGQDRSGYEPGYPYRYKLNFMRTMIDHIISCGYHNEKFIIGGDFNITRDDSDTYDPAIWNHTRISCTPLERQSIADFIEITSAVDLMRKYNCNSFTWYDYRINSFSSNRGLRIDYLFASNRVETLWCNADSKYRGLSRPSDHVPVIAQVICS